VRPPESFAGETAEHGRARHTKPAARIVDVLEEVILDDILDINGLIFRYPSSLTTQAKRLHVL
jgi:hypothetical protein